MRGKIQQLIASYFISQNSYPIAHEFRDQVMQHKEARMPLNFHKYSFVHPEQAEKSLRLRGCCIDKASKGLLQGSKELRYNLQVL